MRKYETWDEFMDRAKDNGLSPTLQETIDKKDEVNMNTKERKDQQKSDEFQELQFKEPKPGPNNIKCEIRSIDGQTIFGEIDVSYNKTLDDFIEAHTGDSFRIINAVVYSPDVKAHTIILVMRVFKQHVLLMFEKI